MNAGGSCDECWCLSFFWLSQNWPVNSRIPEQVFSDSTVPPDSEETELGSSDQEASPSACKNTGVVLVPCSRMEVYPCSVSLEVYPYSHHFQWCEYFWRHLLRQMSSQWGSQKLLPGLVSHELTAYLYIFHQFKLNELWPYYQQHVHQISLNRTTL